MEIIPHLQSNKETECQNTCDLLKKCLAGMGCPPLAKEGARALRKRINRVYTDFEKAIGKGDVAQINAMVADDAPFAGLMRWQLKNEYPAIYSEVV